MEEAEGEGEVFGFLLICRSCPMTAMKLRQNVAEAGRQGLSTHVREAVFPAYSNSLWPKRAEEQRKHCQILIKKSSLK